MSIRKLPGTLVLGLLASLAAHGGLYGNGHAAGGSLHGLLTALAVGGAVGLAALLALGACGAAGRCADGSVLARRLTDRLPSLPLLLSSAAAWFSLGEALEAPHADGTMLATIACLVLASWLLSRIAEGIVRLIAAIVIAIARGAFAPRLASWRRCFATPHIALCAPHLLRRFARPPPKAFLALWVHAI